MVAFELDDRAKARVARQSAIDASHRNRIEGGTDTQTTRTRKSARERRGPVTLTKGSWVARVTDAVRMAI